MSRVLDSIRGTAQMKKKKKKGPKKEAEGDGCKSVLKYKALFKFHKVLGSIYLFNLSFRNSRFIPLRRSELVWFEGCLRGWGASQLEEAELAF
eukprot:s9873_g1.t1